MALKNQTHQKAILDAAQRLLLERGLPGMRVDDVCAAAGVTKGSFYHHFESKEQMARILLEGFFRQLAEALSAGGWTTLDDPRNRVLGFVDRAIDIAGGPLLRRGCVMGSLTVDSAATDATLRADLKTKFGTVIDLFSPHIEASLRSKKMTPKDARSESQALARQFVAVMEGAIILSKATENPDELANALRCFRTLIAHRLTTSPV